MASKVKNDRRYVRQYGGNGDDYIEVAATVAARSGTFTSASGTMRYKRVGNMVHIFFSITITTVGTGSFPEISNLPFSAKSFGAVGFAREHATTGLMWLGTTEVGNKVLYFTRYDNSTVVASGYNFVGTATYETEDT